MTLPGLQNVPAGFKQCHLKACYVTEKTSRKRDLRREGWEIQEKKTLLGEASTPPPLKLQPELGGICSQD